MEQLDLSILKYYKEGNEFCGFEKGQPWESLLAKGFLDYDLELTRKGYEFINSYENWENVTAYNNDMKISIKVNL
jgi:hypothetical protein